MPSKTRKPRAKPKRLPAAAAAQARVVILAMYDYHLAEDNGKHGLIGIFDTLRAARFPSPLTFFLFARLAGTAGRHVLVLELSDGQRTLMQLPATSFRLPDRPMAYHDVIVRVTAEFPGPGVYEWRARLDGKPAAHYAFQVSASKG